MPPNVSNTSSRIDIASSATQITASTAGTALSAASFSMVFYTTATTPPMLIAVSTVFTISTAIAFPALIDFSAALLIVSVAFLAFSKYKTTKKLKAVEQAHTDCIPTQKAS